LFSAAISIITPKSASSKLVPATGNSTQRKTVASRAALEAFLDKTHAQLWIQHDFTGTAKLKKAPGITTRVARCSLRRLDGLGGELHDIGGRCRPPHQLLTWAPFEADVEAELFISARNSGSVMVASKPSRNVFVLPGANPEAPRTGAAMVRREKISFSAAFSLGSFVRSPAMARQADPAVFDAELQRHNELFVVEQVLLSAHQARPGPAAAASISPRCTERIASGCPVT